jgi:hypothetical protein
MVRIFPSLIRGKKWGLLMPSIFAPSCTDTLIRRGVSSDRSRFVFSGGVHAGIWMPEFVLSGIVIMSGF